MKKFFILFCLVAVFIFEPFCLADAPVMSGFNTKNNSNQNVINASYPSITRVYDKGIQPSAGQYSSFCINSSDKKFCTYPAGYYFPRYTTYYSANYTNDYYKNTNNIICINKKTDKPVDCDNLPFSKSNIVCIDKATSKTVNCP